MIVIPDLFRRPDRDGLREGLSSPGSSPASSPSPVPSRYLALDGSPPHQPGRWWRKVVFDWLALAQWGLPAVAALGIHGLERVASALRGCPRVFLAFDNDDAGREASERLAGLLGGRVDVITLHKDVGDVAELAIHPNGRATFLRLLAKAARSQR